MNDKAPDAAGRSGEDAPRARHDDVDTRRIDGELLIYDARSRQAHSLNPVAGFLYDHLDGSRSLEDLARLAHEKLEVPEDLELVQFGCQELEKAGLLAPAGRSPQVSRRVLIKRLGLSLAMLPVVSTFSSPAAANQSDTVARLKQIIQSLIDWYQRMRDKLADGNRLLEGILRRLARLRQGQNLQKAGPGGLPVNGQLAGGDQEEIRRLIKNADALVKKLHETLGDLGNPPVAPSKQPVAEGLKRQLEAEAATSRSLLDQYDRERSSFSSFL